MKLFNGSRFDEEASGGRFKALVHKARRYDDLVRTTRAAPAAAS